MAKDTSLTKIVNFVCPFFMQSRVPYLLCFFLPWASVLFSQTIDWTSPEDPDRQFPYTRIIGQDNDGYFVLKTNLSFEDERNRVGFKTRKFTLAYYSTATGIRWRKPVTSSKKNSSIEKIIVVNGKVVVLSTVMNKSVSKYDVYAQFINKQGAYEKEPVKVDQCPLVVNEEYEFDIKFSADPGHIACITKNLPGTGDKQMLSIAMLNDTLGIQWRKFVEIPYSKKNLSIDDFRLSNNGELYMLGFKYGNDKRIKTPGQSGFILFTYNNSVGAVTEQQITVEDKFLTDAGFSIDETNNKVVIAGFYSDKTTFSTAGTFFASYDLASQSITGVKTQKFDDNFIDRFVGERKTNGKELIHYSIDRIVLRNDGGGVIVAEASYVTEYSYYDAFTQTIITRTNYNYNNILVISINADGTIDWSQVINKNQTTGNDGGYYLSYCSLIHLDKIWFVFNKYGEKRNNVMLFFVNNKGQQENKILFGELEDIIIIPKGGRQVDENILVVPAMRKKKFSFVKLTF